MLNWKKIFVPVMVFAAAVSAVAAAGQKLNVWPEDSSEASRWGCSQGAKWVFDNNGTVLNVTTASKAPGDSCLNSRRISKNELEKYIGYAVEFSVWIKGENISRPDPSFCGTKFMVVTRTGGVSSTQAATDGLHGTYEWRKFSVTTMINPGIEGIEILLGIQNAQGQAHFRDFEARLIPPAALAEVPFELPENFRCEYSEDIMNMKPKRGVMCNDPRLFWLDDMRDLSKWGANLIRWQFNASPSTDLEKYRNALDASLEKLISMAPELEKLGIRVVFDMHTPPGGRYSEPSVLGTAGALAKLDGSACLRLYQEELYQKAFVSTWKYIATRLKDIPAVWAYDLLNEPTSGGIKGKYNYLGSQYAAAQAIREVDAVRPIIVESDDWASVNSFGYLLPLPLRNIFYSFHFYTPGEYTHQGTSPIQLEAVRAGKMSAYPGSIFGSYVDKDYLRGALEPVVAFQEKYGAKIFCGEFSVVRWAPGADQWLEDVLAIFAEHDWSWTYHAFREWHGWSVEHDDDCDNEQPVDYVTIRKQLLLNEFKKNLVGE